MSVAIEKIDDLLPDDISIAACIRNVSADDSSEVPTNQFESPKPSPTGSPRPGFAGVPAKPAVYACLTATGCPIVVATTANLRRALQSRLLSQPATTARANYAEITDTVRYRRVGSAFAASWWYYRTVRSLFPDRYRAMLAWRPAWFVTVNPETEFPRFQISNAVAHPMASGTICVGPLLTRRNAKAIVESIEGLFDLCRYYEILRQAPLGHACAYKQLGKCPAPCDGTISMTEYRMQVLQAAGFLSDAYGTRMQWCQRQESLMCEAASKLDFRLAAMLKRKLDQADALIADKLTEVHRMDNWKYLILQRGKTRQWIAPFVALPGRIVSLPEVHYLLAADSLRSWMEVCNQSQPGPGPIAEFPVEEIATLVTYHNYRANDAGLYIPMDGHLTADSILQAINIWLNYKGNYEIAEINSTKQVASEDPCQ